MPIFGPKNVNSVKTTLYYGSKKSVECLFLKKNSRKYPKTTAKKSEAPLQNTVQYQTKKRQKRQKVQK